MLLLQTYRFRCRLHHSTSCRLNRVLKYYNYYFLEDEDNLGEWYIGTEQKNGAIEGRTCCESLQFAFELI